LLIFDLPRQYKNFIRLRDISNVLIKHGFGHLIQRFHLSGALAFSRRIFFFKKTSRKIRDLTFPVRFRLVLEELGPTFVKFGQLISSRPDLVPLDLIEELKKLQDDVPPISYTEVSLVIEDEFKKSIDKVFLYFRRDPSAAASIAQVHQAKLQNGEEVIVKIQRPGIVKTIERDLDVLSYLAKFLERYVPESRVYRPRGIVDEFSKSIKKEIDFLAEATNAQRVKDNFRQDPTVFIPKVFWDYSTRRVLMLEQVRGIRVDDVEQLTRTGLDLKKIAANGCDAFLEQVFVHGFFHADPHPGNILVMKDGTIAFLDFGIVGRINPVMLTHIANIFVYIIERDYDSLVHEYLMMGFITAETNVRRFREDVIDFFEPYYGRTLRNLPVGLIFNRTIQLMAKHHIQTPLEWILLGKTIVFIDGIGRQLDMDFNLLEQARPFAADLIKRRVSPRRLAKEATKSISDLFDLLKILPGQSQVLLSRMLRGDLEIRLVNEELVQLLRDFKTSIGRIYIGLVISSLIVGSFVIVAMDTGPHLLGVPIVALAGFLMAGILSTRVWLAKLFSRR
jgi:ubiquinone biosynthesis protein